MLESGQPERRIGFTVGAEATAKRCFGWAGRQGGDPGAPSLPIDLAFLRRYTLGDAAVEREVLELFCSHAPAIVAELKSASSEKAWRNAAHSLKGSARALGAWAVARGAEQAEAASPHYWQAGEIVASLERAVEEVRRYVATIGVDAERPRPAAT
jgi:HPt (histidine-containing phosphotransfer) domain-containing protein